MTLAFKYFDMAAKQNNLDALYKLSYCYFNGIGTKKDEFSAIKLMNKAADLGSATAQYEMAVFYFNGDMGDRRLNEAIKYCQKAYSQGLPEASELLNQIYESRDKFDIVPYSTQLPTYNHYVFV